MNVDEIEQSAIVVGADAPPMPVIDVPTDNAMPTTIVVPPMVSTSQLLEFVATEIETNRQIHPELRQRINALLARHNRSLQLAQDNEDDEHFEIVLSSFQSMVRNINRWLHTHNPVATTYRRQTPSSNPRIQAFNKNASKIRQQALTADLAESFPKPVSSVRLLNSVFPLGRIFNKWKNGIRLFLRTTHLRQPRDHRTNDCMDKTIQNLLESDIIRETKSGPFESNIFLVPKSN